MIKTFSKILALTAIAALAVASCKKDEVVKYLSANIIIDESALGDAPSPGSYDVTFTSTTTEYSIKTTSSGTIVTVDNLVTGVYDVTVQAAFSHAGYAYNYIGTAKNVEISANGVDCTIKVAATKAAALVFKEIYYNGCKDNNSANLLYDGFIEIYNNSDQTVYADGLCVGMILSPNTYEWEYVPAGTEYKEKTYDYDLGIQNSQDYFFVGNTVWQVPGNGTDYPVAPGESIVIASYAMNHTANASASIDLSTADFENWCQHYSDANAQADCNAINMNLVAAVAAPTKFYSITVTGRGVVLFHQDTPIRNTDFIRSSNYPTSVGLEVLKKDLIDAVDLVATATTKKWVHEDFDAGKVLSQGNYSGKSVLRKISSTTTDGRVILQDTNNSSEDFIYCTDESLEVKEKQIRRFGAGRPSWSTWTTAQ